MSLAEIIFRQVCFVMMHAFTEQIAGIPDSSRIPDLNSVAVMTAALKIYGGKL